MYILFDLVFYINDIKNKPLKNQMTAGISLPRLLASGKKKKKLANVSIYSA